MAQLDSGVVAAAGLAVGVLGLVLALQAHVRLTRLVRRGVPVRVQGGRGAAAGAVGGDEQGDAVRGPAIADPFALRHVGLVRYDAFGDTGGRLSFSAALVDDGGNGLVISSIHARNETRTYAKGLLDGRSENPLSPEEKQAVELARTRRRT